MIKIQAKVDNAQNPKTISNLLQLYSQVVASKGECELKFLGLLQDNYQRNNKQEKGQSDFLMEEMKRQLLEAKTNQDSQTQQNMKQAMVNQDLTEDKDKLQQTLKRLEQQIVQESLQRTEDENKQQKQLQEILGQQSLMDKQLQDSQQQVLQLQELNNLTKQQLNDLLIEQMQHGLQTQLLVELQTQLEILKQDIEDGQIKVEEVNQQLNETLIDNVKMQDLKYELDIQIDQIYSKTMRLNLQNQLQTGYETPEIRNGETSIKNYQVQDRLQKYCKILKTLDELYQQICSEQCDRKPQRMLTQNVKPQTEKKLNSINSSIRFLIKTQYKSHRNSEDQSFLSNSLRFSEPYIMKPKHDNFEIRNLNLEQILDRNSDDDKLQTSNDVTSDRPVHKQF